jgi:class 3 adenylate cyclase
MSKREQLEQTIAALEAQRAILGDAVVDTAIVPLREKLNELEAPSTGKIHEEEQQRKQITVLFAEFSGFKAVSETMDVEEVGDTMNALWQRIDEAITAHGGLIDKHISNTVMALFGVPSAREDDSERAIRTALKIRTEAVAFCEKQQINLTMRIGINTGAVILSNVGTTKEYTAMGDTVNLASRLEHAASPGQILISHDTYRHVRGVFDVQVLEPITVKGKRSRFRSTSSREPSPALSALPCGRWRDLKPTWLDETLNLNSYKKGCVRSLRNVKHRSSRWSAKPE